MASLKSIKSKILSYKKTGTVTHAMEAVSAVKMRKAQERALSMRPYARAALRMLGSVSGSIEALRHPLTRHVQTGKVAIIIITSDKGLAGSLNSAVIRKTEQFIREETLSQAELSFFCLGKRGYEFALRRGFEILHHHTNISDGIDELEFNQISEKVIELAMKGVFREVRVAYTHFRSTFEQQAEMHKILPLSQKIMDHIVKSIPPEKGKYAELAQETNGVQTYTIEPEPEVVLGVLLPKLVNVAIFHKLLESKASEHSARMVAMKNATDKVKEMTHGLTRKFNKARQAAITREVSEITSGIEAMR
ncbi:MAG TPA: ATP synthase F1 subunit gamma [Candidatus Paceibacterota bacterium]